VCVRVRPPRRSVLVRAHPATAAAPVAHAPLPRALRPTASPPGTRSALTPPAHRSGSAQLGKDKPIPYLRTWYFSDDIPDLVEDFTPPPLFHSSDAFLRLPEDLRPPFRWLFFGPAGTESKLHVDVWETDAWLGNLEGEKVFTLYHPSMRPYIEREENDWVDLRMPVDAERFPKFTKAVPAQTTLKAGEIIYIPRRCVQTVLQPSPGGPAVSTFQG